ncbi:MAG: hypothetical protein R2731_07340 [Nocardioides sp.]
MATSHPRTLVVQITLTDAEHDVDKRVTFLGRDFRVVRRGAAGDLEKAAELVRSWAPKAAALAVSGLREARALGLYDGRLDALDDLVEEAGDTPVTVGRALHDVLTEWAVRHVHTEMPGFWSNARTVVLGDTNHDAALRILKEHTENLEFADPAMRFDLPHTLAEHPLLGLAAEVGSWPLRMLPEALHGPLHVPEQVSHALARRAARECDVVVASYEELTGFGLEDLAGKTLISCAISDERLTELGDRGVDLVVDAVPQPFGFTVDAALLEALMLTMSPTPGRLPQDVLLELVDEMHAPPRLLYPNGPRRKSRFAFVIHPLSQQYFRNVEPLGTLAKVAPSQVMDLVEKAVAFAPPFKYSHVTGIKSPTGAEAEGWLITVGARPGADGAQPRVLPTPDCCRPPTPRASSALRSWGWAPSPRSSATPG